MRNSQAGDARENKNVCCFKARHLVDLQSCRFLLRSNLPTGGLGLGCSIGRAERKTKAHYHPKRRLLHLPSPDDKYLKIMALYTSFGALVDLIDSKGYIPSSRLTFDMQVIDNANAADDVAIVLGGRLHINL